MTFAHIAMDQLRMTAADYPLEALRRHEEGLVRADLTIDEHGKITGCTVTQSSRSASLDKATCKLAHRLQATPASDDAGRPIASTYKLNFRWSLPASAVIVLAPARDSRDLTQPPRQ